MQKKCVICKISENTKKMLIIKNDQKIGNKIYNMSVYLCSIGCLKKYNASYLHMRKIIKTFKYDQNCFTCGSPNIDEEINYFNVDEKGEIRPKKFCSNECYQKNIAAQAITKNLLEKFIKNI